MINMRFAAILALLMVMTIVPSKLLAFSGSGHQIVCQIAYLELSDTARTKIDHLIKIDPEYASFAKSCTWPDSPKIRRNEHYVNLERGSVGIGDDPCPVADRCVVTAISDDMNNLAQADDEGTQLVLLKSLGHWMGDIHQPLHVSFKDDRGGNKIKSTSPCKGNLHAVWDKCIIKRMIGKDSMQLAENLWDEVTDQDRKAWAGVKIDQTTISSWANESFKITVQASTGYCSTVGRECWYTSSRKQYVKGDDKKVVPTNEAYLDRQCPIIERQLEKAGVRLAQILNLMFE
ncbi:MAG: S1/P1 nuclease [Alphaproteobacteria bacterium]|nr:S1/P1 nuclease [Alphaproteobacteria bacterium]